MSKKCFRLTRVRLWKQWLVFVCGGTESARFPLLPPASQHTQESLSDIRRLRNVIVVRQRKEWKNGERNPYGRRDAAQQDWLVCCSDSEFTGLRGRTYSGKTWTTRGACCWLALVFFHFPHCSMSLCLALNSARPTFCLGGAWQKKVYFKLRWTKTLCKDTNYWLNVFTKPKFTFLHWRRLITLINSAHEVSNKPATGRLLSAHTPWQKRKLVWLSHTHSGPSWARKNFLEASCIILMQDTEMIGWPLILF